MAPKKQQKMSLGDFLGDQSLGSWADEMEDMPVSSDARAGYGGAERRNFTAPSGGGLGMGDRSYSSRGFATREELPMPSKPPFTAHLANLSFDATEGDVQDFFQDCGVVSVRIVEDRVENKPKGFGYVEFKTVDGLKTALNKSGSDFLGRSVRLSVADPPKDRGEARELTDWTRKGPLADLPRSQQRPSERAGGFERSFSRGYEAAPAGGAADRGPRREAPFNDGPPPPARDLDWGARKGPLAALPPAERPERDAARVRSNDGQGPHERHNSPAWGEGTNRSQDGSRPPRGDRPPIERAPTEAEKESQWRTKMRPDAPQKSPTPTPDASMPSSPAQAPAPATRPRLNLQKRTVSEAEPSPTAAATSGDSKASPFGAAKPIDTSAREKEIEEKREIAFRQKKETDDKARADRKAQAEKEKAERLSAAREAAPQEKAEEAAEENGEENSKQGNYEILHRSTEENGENGDVAEEEADAEGIDASANGTIVDDKAVKPKEITRDPPSAPRGTWRKGFNAKNDAAEADGETTAETLEGDGWSTVTQKPRNPPTRGRGRGRGGHGGPGARAIAS